MEKGEADITVPGWILGEVQIAMKWKVHFAINGKTECWGKDKEMGRRIVLLNDKLCAPFNCLIGDGFLIYKMLMPNISILIGKAKYHCAPICTVSVIQAIFVVSEFGQFMIGKHSL